MSQKIAKQNAGLAAVQILFVSGRAWDIKVLVRELQSLGEYGHVSAEALVLSLMTVNADLRRVGMELTFHTGRVQLTTMRVRGKLSDYLTTIHGEGSSQITPIQWEVLAVVALNGPVIAAEVSRILGVDRRDVLDRLDLMGLVERRAVGTAHDVFIATPAFIEQLGGEQALATARAGAGFAMVPH